MDAFDGIYLEDSYVLEINESSPVTLRCEFVLLPGHLLYNDPLPGEAHCYRNGRIEFRESARITWLEKWPSKTTDLDGTEHYGNLYSIEQDGRNFRVIGSFGSFQVEAQECNLVLD